MINPKIYPKQNRLAGLMKDISMLKVIEARPVQPSDILSPPIITFQEYKCPKCNNKSFKLVSAPIVSMAHGWVVHLKCIRCNTVTSSGMVKAQIQEQITPK